MAPRQLNPETDGPAACAIERIAGLAGIGLVHEIADDGRRYGPAFRPLSAPRGYMFRIHLTEGSRFAHALFEPGDYSGPLVRRIEETIRADPESWRAQVDEVAAQGVDVACTADDDVTDPNDWPGMPPWCRFEIEARTRVSRTATLDEWVTALEKVGAACLMMVLAGLELDDEDFIAEPGLPEGARVALLVNRYERNPLNRIRCIERFGPECQACGLRFRDRYGPVAGDFIEVHHVTPVSELGADYIVDPVRDLVPLCSNCHSMAHRASPPMTVAEIRSLLTEFTDRAAGSNSVSLA